MAGLYAHVAPSTAISAGTLPDRGVPSERLQKRHRPSPIVFRGPLSCGSFHSDVLHAKIVVDGMIAIHSASTRRERPIILRRRFTSVSRATAGRVTMALLP